MSTTAAAVDLGPARAADAARAIFHDPSATGLHEPAGPDECAAADDAGASQVRIVHADDALLAVHDGQPLTLRNVQRSPRRGSPRSATTPA